MPCGRPPRNLASHEQALLTRLGAEPDATLAELRDWLAAERPVPYGHWKTTTFVAGLRCDGLTAPFVIDGPINGEWARNPCAAALRGFKISHVRVKRLVKTR